MVAEATNGEIWVSFVLVASLAFYQGLALGAFAQLACRRRFCLELPKLFLFLAHAAFPRAAFACFESVGLVSPWLSFLPADLANFQWFLKTGGALPRVSFERPEICKVCFATDAEFTIFTSAVCISFKQSMRPAEF